MSGKPGPVYLDLPGDVLFAEVDEARVEWPDAWDPALARPRPGRGPAEIEASVALLAEAERPVVVSGSGILWSGAEAAFQRSSKRRASRSTPRRRAGARSRRTTRSSFLTARSIAFREADLILVIGTRMNYVIGHASRRRASTPTPS